MALSEWDQSRLREIEEHTRATDPDFVTRLDLAVVLRHRRQLRRMCWWLQALGAWMTLMGLSAAHGVISDRGDGRRRRLRVDGVVRPHRARFASFDTTPLRIASAGSGSFMGRGQALSPRSPASGVPRSGGFSCAREDTSFGRAVDEPDTGTVLPPAIRTGCPADISLTKFIVKGVGYVHVHQ